MAAVQALSSPIPVPRGGGALRGIGEKFAPNAQTGTGTYGVPLQIPGGRGGFQPELRLSYSSGDGNGSFGHGWSLPVPAVSRLTSKGVPRYRDNGSPEDRDTFVLAGAEDLVEIGSTSDGAVVTRRYRPRTEGLFAEITRRVDGGSDVWTVRTPDGRTSTYGSASRLADATIADPNAPSKIFAWQLSDVVDPFGNRIEYRYRRDRVAGDLRSWDQLYLRSVAYVDLDGSRQAPFLVDVTLTYDDEPAPAGVKPSVASRPRSDTLSSYRSGFEIRTRRRCKWIVVRTHPAAGATLPLRAYELVYSDELDPGDDRLHVNGASLLAAVHPIGFDDKGVAHRELPPVEFTYSRFRPDSQRLAPLSGDRLPTGSVLDPEFALVDLFGGGLPDIVEFGESVRYWRNLGGLRFERPRELTAVPGGLPLDGGAVQVTDVSGDARSDLLVTTGPVAGYFPLDFHGGFSKRSFHRFAQAPTFSLDDDEARLLDLTGDGAVDVLRTGTRFECFFGDVDLGWLPQNTVRIPRRGLDRFPDVSFADRRVKVADMSGDGLPDIALVHASHVDYWPNLGHGRFGARIRLPLPGRLPFDYDPAHVVLGDVDGDGVAELVLVSDRSVSIWFNRCGDSFAEPVVIRGTPALTGTDAVRLVDVLGNGTVGLLWSSAADGSGRPNHHFLDLTGSTKPNLLVGVDNNLGAITEIQYRPSTEFYLADAPRPATRWRTTLPFPVQVVARVTVRDVFSATELTTEYRYHHGYWDGAEREYRGFAMVEQLDREAGVYPGRGLSDAPIQPTTDAGSSPALSRTWFHQGPVERDDDGRWRELDWSAEYWAGDPQLLDHTEELNSALATLPVQSRRSALRTLRGSPLRTELYALDGSPIQYRPYVVTEYAFTVREEPTAGLDRVFTPLPVAERTTQWERGNDPLTQLTRLSGHDEFGQPTRKVSIACPRGWRRLGDTPAQGYLATLAHTAFATPSEPGVYIHDRVARERLFEILGTGGRSIADVAALTEQSAGLRVISEARNFYDATDDPTVEYGAFVGRPLGEVGAFGALVRTESLVMTRTQLTQACGTVPPYLVPGSMASPTAEYPPAFLQAQHGLSGYTYRSAGPDSSEGYFATTVSSRYDFHNPTGQGRGLALAQRDPRGNETTTSYDSFGLLPARVRDPVGAEHSATYDRRTLQVTEVVDPNGNVTRLAYSPMGLVVDTWALGKVAAPATDRRNCGDRAAASVHVDYDLWAYARSAASGRGAPQPIWARVVQRVRRDSDPSDNGEMIEVREYSDGLGRSLQTRALGEEVRFGDGVFGGGDDLLPGTPGSVDPALVRGDPSTDPTLPHVVVTGWQRYDGKGRVVEKFEPFWSAGWSYEAPTADQTGHRIRIAYDPLGRQVATTHPGGAEQTVVHGIPTDLDAPPARPADTEAFSPTPWVRFVYDANDSAGRTHRAAAQAYRHHWNTPESVVVDALGRAIRSVRRTRETPASATAPLMPVEEHATVRRYDIAGNLVAVRDPLGRETFAYEYDHAGRMLRGWSVDGGARVTIPDAAGHPIEVRDAKQALRLHTYDRLGRRVRCWARDHGDDEVTLREMAVYGDDPAAPGTWSQRQDDNLVHRLWRSYDEAGLEQVSSYDFIGNVLTHTRWVISDAFLLEALDQPAATAFTVDWASASGPELDPTGYETLTAFDALGRPTSTTLPVCANDERFRIEPSFNRAGELSRLELVGPLDPTGTGPRRTFVERIAYNARGQRVLVAHGNGLLTRLAYDEQTFQLARLHTQRYRADGRHAYTTSGSVVQDCAYAYDLSGNVLRAAERTRGCGIAGSASGPDALDRNFEYDPLYRLVSASGRECTALAPTRPWYDYEPCGWNGASTGTPNLANAPSMSSPYRERYEYDPAGNLVALRHGQGGAAAWVRHFGVSGFRPRQWLDLVAAWRRGEAVDWGSGDNRMTHAGAEDASTSHAYDACGNLVRETAERHHEWDHSNRLVAFRNQVGTSKPTVDARYLYDSAGNRLKKVVRAGAGYRSTTYVAGVFEHHRVVEAATTTENCLLHITDDLARVALVRVGDPLPDDGAPDHAVQYQFGDRLGHAVLTVAEDGQTMRAEEFYPFGETSFGGYRRKRYRFLGRERDEESGLVHIGARYLVPWLLRWASVDPATDASAHAYSYAANSPASLIDPDGQAEGDPPLECKVSAHFSDVLQRYAKYGWSYDREVEATINGIPAKADNILRTPMSNRVWFEVKRDEPGQRGSLSRRNGNQPLYYEALKTNRATVIPTVDKSNTGLKAGQQIKYEYIEFNWKTRDDFENWLKQNTPGLDQPKKAAVPPMLRRAGVVLGRLGQGLKQAAPGVLAAALVYFATARSAHAATAQQEAALIAAAPQIEQYLVNNPDKGVLIVSTFRIDEIEHAYTSTKYGSSQVVRGFADEESARRSADETAYLSLGANWHTCYLAKSYVWLEPLNTKVVPVAADR